MRNIYDDESANGTFSSRYTEINNYAGLYNFNAFEDAVKTLIAAARENNVEVVYVRKHGNMRKENNHAVIPVRKNLFTDGEGIWEDPKG